MRVLSTSLAILASLSLKSPFSSGFVPQRVATRVSFRQELPLIHDCNNNNSLLGKTQVLFSTSTSDNETSSPASPSSDKKKKKKKLGLITFDLDDTLYPIEPVLNEANAAFSQAMSNFGYTGIQPSEIVEAGKEIRARVSADVEAGSSVAVDPLKPTTVNHKEIRLAAIRKEMEQFILKTKLKQTAEDWATDVDDLTAPVRKSAEK